MWFGDLFLLRATGARAGMFLMPSLLLGALPAHSLLAVPCALLHHRSDDPGAAAVCSPSVEGFSSLFRRLGFNFGCQRSKMDEKARVS